MGTRHLICVYIDGEYKVAQYGQWDGYPSGQGVDILNFLHHTFDREVFIEKVRKVDWITKEEMSKRWVEAGAEPDAEFVSFDVSEKFAKLYPENSRDTGARVLDVIQKSDRDIRLRNDIDFAKDSAFCEWGYVIDLDKNTFEVYKGFNTKPLDKSERFYNNNESINDCYSIRHLKTYDLDSLPTKQEFLIQIKELVGEDDYI